MIFKLFYQNLVQTFSLCVLLPWFLLKRVSFPVLVFRLKNKLPEILSLSEAANLCVYLRTKYKNVDILSRQSLEDL